MTPARFRWGLFLILIGTLLLLRNFDVLNDNLWIDLGILLPIVLIAVGIEKIFTKTRFRFISYLTSVVLFVGGLAVAFAGSQGGADTGFFSRTTYTAGFEPDVRLIRATFELDESDLTIRDSGDDLVYARFEKYTRKPKIEYTKVNDEARIEMVNRSGGFLGGAVKIETDDPQDWVVRFSEQVPVDIQCSGYSSDMHFNMTTTRLRELDLEADNSDIYLVLGDLEPNVQISIFGQDTDLRLRIPRTVGLRIFGEEYRGYLNTIGLEEQADGFVSEGFDTLPSKIEVKLDDRLSSFSIDFF